MAELIDQVKQIAQEAGKEILRIYRSADSIEIKIKDDKSPLTLADRTSHEIISDGLSLMKNALPVISEEGLQPIFAERKHYKKYWLVDPLDGTREFVKRSDEFTVNIALMDLGIPVMGVVYVPVSGELYWAEKHKGAFKMEPGGSIIRLHAHDFDIRAKGLRILCSRSHINAATRSYIENFDEPELISTGSSLKFLWIAENKADIYPRLGPTMEWDTAAAQVILHEAGGQVVRYLDRVPLEYNKRSLENPHFLAFARIRKNDERKKSFIIP